MPVRRLLLTAILVVAALVSNTAAGPIATVVLASGERYTGELLYRSGAIGITTDDGRGMSWPLTQIAVVEFAPGDPAPDELSSLPVQGSSTARVRTVALVLQDGQVVTGRLADMANDGTRVTIANAQNERDNYFANDIARLYVNPSAASRLYASSGAAPGAVGTSGQSNAAMPRQTAGAAIRVNARARWTATNMTVRRGDRLMFETTGEVRPIGTAGTVGAAGGAGTSPNYPVPTAPVGALIGRIGNSEPFLIGDSGEPVVMPADGELFLGVNDDAVSDNSGTFMVRVGPPASFAGTTGRGQSTIPFGTTGVMIAVDARQPWTATNITVREGERIAFRVRGPITWANGPNDQAGADGGALDPRHQQSYPVPAAGVGALVGRVGDGQPFLVGASGQTIVMPASGQLFLGVNDDHFNDNAGTYQVTVQRDDAR